MEVLLGVIVGLIILVILVVIHELGHGIVARRNGVVVEEFGVGFPPKAREWKLKRSILGRNVRYTLNWLPLGGFVKLQGEHDADQKKGDYGAASFWVKTKILLAGVAMNWVAAAVLFTILALVGMPKIVDGQFSIASDTRVERSAAKLTFIGKDSPAEKAGLQTKDELVKVAGTSLASSSQLSELTKENKGKSIEIEYRRNGELRRTTAELRASQEGGKGYLGASAGQEEISYSTWSAPIVGIGLTGQMTWLTLQGLGDTLASFVSGLFQKVIPNEASQQKANQNLEKASQNVAGPVGLLGAILPGLLEAGPRYVVLIAAVISLSLAVLNTLPIPALDGGRWFVTALYRVMKRPLSAETEEKIHGTGFMVLMGLFVLITVADVGKIFG